jgi:hypothetical protein
LLSSLITDTDKVACEGRKRVVIIAMIAALLGTFSLGAIALFGLTMTYPLHASCKIDW